MSESVYTAQDRANEGCCWTYYRDHCPGGGCLCDCHATNEEILLSDRARLRREVDRERQAFAELTTASVSRIEQLTARAEAAEQQAARLSAALSDLRRGCMAGSGRACRLCLGSWVDAETIEDHHPWCPMGPTVELFRAALAASQPAPADESHPACRLCTHPRDGHLGASWCSRCNCERYEAEDPRGGQAEGEG